MLISQYPSVCTLYIQYSLLRIFAQTHLSNIGAPAHSHARQHSVGGQAFPNSPIYVLSFVPYMLVNTLSEGKHFPTVPYMSFHLSHICSSTLCLTARISQQAFFSPQSMEQMCYFPTLILQKKIEIARIKKKVKTG